MVALLHCLAGFGATLDRPCLPQVYVSQLLDEGLPDDRPPWEMRLLASCGARRSEVAIVLRVHHAMADGDALVRVLCSALADHPTARPKQVGRERGSACWVGNQRAPRAHE